MEKILLTGGAGFIGSHTAVELLEKGWDVIIADDLSNSDASVIEGIYAITGIRPQFYEIDVSDEEAVEDIFAENDIDAVIHFAGYKAVAESIEKPLEYYANNLDTALTVLKVMKRHGVKRFVFSSSASLYSLTEELPFAEEAPTAGETNPYGHTKHMIEQILKDACAADPGMSAVILRYFNAVGAHPSGLIGEAPRGVPDNLMPFIVQVAKGARDKLYVFGDDYPTADGTAVRDYIHVSDLAAGHVAALNYGSTRKGAEVFNLGTGKGSSVLEVVRTFERENGVKIPCEIGQRRAGDIPVCLADTTKARKLLGFKAEKDLADMCRDAWRWQQRHE